MYVYIDRTTRSTVEPRTRQAMHSFACIPFRVVPPFFFFIQHFPVFFDFCFLNLFSAVTTFGDGFFLFFCEGNWPLFTRTLLYIRSYHGVLLHLGSVRRTQLSNIDLLDLFFSSLFVPLVLTGIV